MPCESGPVPLNERSRRELEHLLSYVWKKLKMTPDPWIKDRYTYSKEALDQGTRLLCDLLRSLKPRTLDRLVYNARDPMSRSLAGWWEWHQAEDRARIREERMAKKKAALKARAFAKLTEAERKAILED